MKAEYFCNVSMAPFTRETNLPAGLANTLAFTVRVLPAEDERLERRRASIAARRKAKSLAAADVPEGLRANGLEWRAHVISVEKRERPQPSHVSES